MIRHDPARSHQRSLFAEDEPPAHTVHAARPPKPDPERRVKCRANGCPAPIHGEKLMCARHWYMVPQDLRNRVWAHYRTGQGLDTASPEWWLASALAVEAVARLEGKDPGNVFRTRYQEFTSKSTQPPKVTAPCSVTSASAEGRPGRDPAAS